MAEPERVYLQSCMYTPETMLRAHRVRALHEVMHMSADWKPLFKKGRDLEGDSESDRKRTKIALCCPGCGEVYSEVESASLISPFAARNKTHKCRKISEIPSAHIRRGLHTWQESVRVREGNHTAQSAGLLKQARRLPTVKYQPLSKFYCSVSHSSQLESQGHQKRVYNHEQQPEREQQPPQEQQSEREQQPAQEQQLERKQQQQQQKQDQEVHLHDQEVTRIVMPSYPPTQSPAEMGQHRNKPPLFLPSICLQVEAEGRNGEASGRASGGEQENEAEKCEPSSEAVLEEQSSLDLKYDSLMCQVCSRGDNDDEMLICDGCELGYHMYCLRPILVVVPPGQWYCPQCFHRGKPPEFPLVQSKIIDFFHIEKPLQFAPEAKRRRRSSSCLTRQKKSRALLAHRPSRDPQQRLRQLASLATALTAIGAEFCSELVYSAPEFPRSANCAQREAREMQVMGPEDQATLEACQAMQQQGESAPLTVCHDPRQGFVVEADDPILDMTIIAEYVGEVDCLASRRGATCDAVMGLLYLGDPSKDLVICPGRKANVARFVSGINNHSMGSRKKINVRCVRYSVGGEARALLVAIRNIRRGERLYYDYNGLEHEYPTLHFD